MADTQLKKKPLYQYIPNMKGTHYNDAFKKEIYLMFSRYLLRPVHSKKWGFPYIDRDGEVKYCLNQFSKRQQPDIETCRCGKDIFPNSENWFVDEKGCRFHPGKLIYSEKQKMDVYTCCNNPILCRGCVLRKHHVTTARVFKENSFVRTTYKKMSYLPTLPNVFALDCEMVYTTKGIEVVKVTVLTAFCDVVYDTYVKPKNPIIDYNTEISGIDESNLEGVYVDLKDVQSDLLQLFDADTIVVGHGLENDFLCLNLYHSKIIDTSILFSHVKGFPYRQSLKALAKTHLKKDIHCSPKGHDSKEDARICVELVARRIFFSKKREMKNAFTLQSQIMANCAAVYYQNTYGVPNFGQPPPPAPIDWNSLYWGSYVPPPPSYPVHVPPQHPLLSFPLYFNSSVMQNKLEQPCN